MSEARRDLIARGLLTLGALLPYWPLLTFSVVFITDDYFASDIFNGELPGRILVGQWLRSGQLPVWTNQLCSGYPLAGAPADPIGLALFTLLPPAAALDAFVIVLLLVAAHGTYALGRRFGADRTGAVLAGVAFAGSGYIACQLKHLAIVSTVVWLPVGLLLIDRALTFADARHRRRLATPLLGVVFAEQVLSGFPQSAYIAALTYGAFALFRAWGGRRNSADGRAVWRPLATLAVAIGLGAAAAAVVLFPLSALGGISDRAGDLGYEWATRLAYWPPNAITFLFPYANGDISDNSYAGPPFFWEDYGYVGFLTVPLALYGAVRDRRRAVALFVVAMTLVAYLFVLGPATPVFKIAYLLIPGIKMFRFPTRFLIVVELGLALLAAIGLTRLRESLERRLGAASRLPALVAMGLCAVTVGDLWFHQPRQNPMVPANAWLAAPATAGAVIADTPQPRTFTPRHRDIHRRTFLQARGWADVAPYFAARDLLEPNVGAAFWNVPSADCYVGISPRWFIDVWGDHNRELSLLYLLAEYDFDAQVLRTHPALPGILRAYGVTHMLTAFPAQGAGLSAPTRAGTAYVYRVAGTARARFVPAARMMDDAQAAKVLLDPGFDVDREVLLHDASAPAPAPPAGAPGGVSGTATTRIVRESQREIQIDADVPADGFLLLADTYYPGWSATVDGRPVALYRANLSVRAIPIPQGRHDVRFTYDPPGVRSGLIVSAVATLALLGWVIAAAGSGRSAGSPRREESAS